MTIAADTVTTAPETAALSPADWSALHCFLHWEPEHVDAFLTGTVAPLMRSLKDVREIEDWFYIRYSEGGPHLRIRMRGARRATVRALRVRLAAAVTAAPHPLRDPAPGWAAHGRIAEAVYEPETDRYGGPAGLIVAEEVFCRSTETAIAAVSRTAAHNQRLVAAVDLVLATAAGLGLDALDTVRWLRRGAIAWRWHRDATTLAPPQVQGPALSAASAKSAVILARWTEISTTVRGGAGGKLRDQWGRRVLAADAELARRGGADRERRLQIWSSQLHMLLNRMGVRPDEERSIGWFIASALLAPDGAADYFADRTTAPDRRYLEASAFAYSRMDHQQPRDVTAPTPQPRYNPYAAPFVALPSGPEPRMPLAEALAARACARGDLGGRVTAGQLGTLLWSAFSTLPDTQVAPSALHPTGVVSGRRPYPSAGAQYPARLRVAVRAVDGLASGLYEADYASRTLRPLGPVPDDAELTSTSMWFGQEGPDAGRVEVATLPVLIGLYLDLGAQRARYGLRALRVALLEAGHLAQNLALTAAATDLSLGILGGFYDDVANETFMLDGIDDFLVYLLPLGRTVGFQ